MNVKGARPERFGSISALLYRGWAEPTLAPLHRRIGAEVPIERGRLLDVGCGPGRLDRLLAAANPDLRVVGLDSSEAMVREARRGPALANLEFRDGSIEDQRFTGEFDFILTVLSFHHWEEPERALEAVHRALAPGGRFRVYEPDSQAPDEEIRKDHAPLWGWLPIPPRLARFLGRNHGFSGAEAETIVRPLFQASSFGSVTITRTGSTLRFDAAK